MQAGQGRIEDRDHERLGRSDAGIILWRKILARELRAIRGRAQAQALANAARRRGADAGVLAEACHVMRGHSPSKTGVNALVTGASFLFAKGMDAGIVTAPGCYRAASGVSPAVPPMLRGSLR